MFTKNICVLICVSCREAVLLKSAESNKCIQVLDPQQHSCMVSSATLYLSCMHSPGSSVIQPDELSSCRSCRQQSQTCCKGRTCDGKELQTHNYRCSKVSAMAVMNQQVKMVIFMRESMQVLYVKIETLMALTWLSQKSTSYSHLVCAHHSLIGKSRKDPIKHHH